MSMARKFPLESAQMRTDLDANGFDIINERTPKARQTDLQAETGAREAEDAALAASIAQKQDNLVSGTNIRTINGQSVLGKGDIAVEGKVITDKTLAVENRAADAQATGEAIASASMTAVWSGVSGKPAEFPPSYHQHETKDVKGLPDELEMMEASKLDAAVRFEELALYDAVPNDYETTGFYLRVSKDSSGGFSASCKTKVPCQILFDPTDGRFNAVYQVGGKLKEGAYALPDGDGYRWSSYLGTGLDGNRKALIFDLIGGSKWDNVTSVSSVRPVKAAPDSNRIGGKTESQLSVAEAASLTGAGVQSLLGGVAFGAAIRYDLNPLVVDSGPIMLSDFAVNSLTADGETFKLYLPHFDDNNAKDMLLVATLSNGAGVTFAATDAAGMPVTYVTEDADALAAEDGINIYSLTEIEYGKFLISRKTVTAYAPTTTTTEEQT